MSNVAEKIESTEQQVSELLNDQGAIAVEIQQAKQQLKTTRALVASLSEDLKNLKRGIGFSFRTDKAESQKRAEIEQQLSQAQAQEQELTILLEDLNDRQQALIEQRQTLQTVKPPSVSVKDLKSHAQAITKARAEITKLQEAIGRQEAIIAKGDTGELDNVLKERARLLADIALGRGSEDQLRKNDDKLAEIQAQAEKNGASVARAEETKAALLPRLTQAQNELQRLEGQRDRMTWLYLATEMEPVVSDYLRLAGEIREALGKLNGYAIVAKEIKGAPKFGAPLSSLVIPDVGLPQTRQHAEKGFIVGGTAPIQETAAIVRQQIKEFL